MALPTIRDLHVLHVTDSLAPGGKERMLVDLANATHRFGRRVSVCVTRDRTDLAKDLDPGINVHVLQRRARWALGPMRHFGALVRDEGITLLHVHGRSSFSFAVFAKLVRLLPPAIPLILHDHHGIEIDDSVPFWFRFWARRWTAAYVGVFQRLGEWARRAGLPADRIFVIENALDLTRLRPAAAVDVRGLLRLPATVPIGVVVCGIRREKGIDFLIDALARQRRAFHVLIVGPDADPEYVAVCRAQAERLGLGDRVTFLGVRSDVAAVLGGCDFALMPSRSESGPLVLIEYMAAGLPIVSVRVGGIAERIAASGGQAFTLPGDVQAFASAVDAVLALTHDERLGRGAWGPPFVAREFDIQSRLPAWDRAYAEALRTAERSREGR